MRRQLILLMLAAASSQAASAGEIRRCVSANGEAMFTNLACPAHSKVEHVADYDPVPDSPVEKIDPASYAAAASARRAQAAAEDAQAAAEAARYAYEEAAAGMQGQQAYDSGYQEIWYPYYTGYGSNFRGHGHGHGDHDHDHGDHDHGHGHPHPRPHDMDGGRTAGGPIVVQQPHVVGGGETRVGRGAMPQAQVQPVRFARGR